MSFYNVWKMNNIKILNKHDFEMAIVVNYDFASFRVGLSLLIIPKRATQELEGLNFTIPCIKEICMDICQ